jgi:hypothetical protein
MTAIISAPAENATVSGLTTIRGSAAGPAFVGYSLAFGAGDAPAQWTTIEETNVTVQNGPLGQWETKGLPNGRYTLRLVVLGGTDSRREITVRVNVQN